MPDPVSLRREGNVAVITVDHPPVNALKQEVRAGLLDHLSRAAADPAIAAIVLAGAGRTFIAGADITEFGQPPKPPILSDVIALLETIAKPTVAALHGTPLGGGLEITFGCHFRVAAPGTRMGLPEIKLGIIPGAGGTQLLPRLVGVERALTMILSGEPITATEALEAGLIDAIIEDDLIDGAIAFARRATATAKPLRHVRDLDERLTPLSAEPQRFAELAARARRKGRGPQASDAAIEAIRGVLTLPVDEGRRRERALFLQLVGGAQARAQRHLFFAERAAAKIPGHGKDGKPRRIETVIKTVAVIGAGTMGGGIAMAFANAGFPVTLIETGTEALARGFDTITRNYQTSVRRGSLRQDAMDERLRLLNGATAMEAAGDADLVIEAVFEEMPVKEAVFAALDRIARPGAVLATNTSYLDVNRIAAVTRRPGDVLGMHFFSPANVMRLVEVVRGAATAPATLALAVAISRRIGKVPAVVGVCHGFVGNRMLAVRQRQAERLLLEGALPQDVDAAMMAFGFPMGPFAMSDLAGLDIGWRNRKALGTRAEIADTLAGMGRYGQKTGRGFYRYEAGSRTPLPDPEVERIIAAAAERLGHTRRPIDAAAIVERLVFPMINEGARILEEGIARRAGDIDVIWVHGYGWPAWRGGPMFYAGETGLARIRDRLAAFAAASGEAELAAAPLLTRLAADGADFSAATITAA